MTILRLDRSTACPAPRKLLLFAASPMSDETYPLLARHVHSCGECAAKSAEFRSTVIGAPPASARAHLSELDIAELVDLSFHALLVDEGSAHLVACASCRAHFAGVCEVLDDAAVVDALAKDGPSVQSPVARVGQHGHRRVLFGSCAAAAVLLVAVAAKEGKVQQLFNRQHPTSPMQVADPLRHATIATAAGPQLISPSGVVPRIDTLRWTEVPGADRYRVEVFDSDGNVTWKAEGPDVFVAVPESVSASWSGRRYWRVMARTSVDRWVNSEFSEVQVVPHIGAGRMPTH